MSVAKVQLSAEELKLAADSQIILTKNLIMQKANELLDGLADDFRQVAGAILPEPHAAKISRGENYLGLPYIVLDYPRFFTADDVLAIRTMMLWGRHISITLHLKGSYRHQLVTERISRKENGDWWLQVKGDEWQHHLDADTHMLLHKIPATQLSEVCKTLPFIKVSAFFAIDQWNEVYGLLKARYETLITALRH